MSGPLPLLDAKYGAPCPPADYALALGASAVLVGRPYIYGLAAGAPGVAHVLHILRTELEVAMALCGCATLADIGPHLLVRN